MLKNKTPLAGLAMLLTFSREAFALTLPVPEPSVFVLFGVGAIVDALVWCNGRGR